jgi:hypothetical protein
MRYLILTLTLILGGGCSTQPDLLDDHRGHHSAIGDDALLLAESLWVRVGELEERVDNLAEAIEDNAAAIEDNAEAIETVTP